MVSFHRAKKRILFVEDHEDSWEIAAYSLEGYALFFASNFTEGLYLAQKGYFDLYILDIGLPDGNGVELCQAIREFDPHTPILFYTAAAYTSDKQRALRAGAQGYLVKPVSLDDLELTAVRLISAARVSVFEARQAEFAAIREELAIRQAKNAEGVEYAEKKSRRAEEKTLRLKAETAFLTAGGTRGEFAREWLLVFKEEMRNGRITDEI